MARRVSRLKPKMQFATEAQRACYGKVAGLLKETFREEQILESETPEFTILAESSLVIVSVRPLGSEESTVEIFAPIVAGADLTVELLRFLLEENNQLHYGAFMMDPAGGIHLAHTLFWSSGIQALRLIVLVMLLKANEYANQIMARWGGQRLLNRWLEMPEPEGLPS